MMMRVLALLFLLAPAGAAMALTGADLRAQGYRVLECRFTQRCLIDAPCERAWREARWYLHDASGTAYREFDDGRLRRALLLLDARWEERSEARQIVTPMREAVASQLTVFDGGGAIQSMQYAADPGSGQFLLGRCEMRREEDAG